MNIGSRYLSNGKAEFVVWAPLKEKMTLHIVHPSDKKIEMQKDGDGYFRLEIEAAMGSKYFFMPDCAKDIPDPASKFQPEGVHGPSEMIDQSYQWNDETWKGISFDELILYEVHVGTFTEEGTFEAMISKLDHLVSTGINAVELMPVAQFPGDRNWGYDGAYPYAVQNSYGGPTRLKKLVDACHQRGIAVFLDVVFNHLGPEGNYLQEFGPYFTDHYKTPWGRGINFDGKWSDEVREFFSDNALYWFENFHIDGLRFDAIHGVYDMGAVHFWQLMHVKIRTLEQHLGKTFYTIAESDLNDPKVIRAVEAGGYGFTAQWLDDFHHSLYAIVDRNRGKWLYADFGGIHQLAKAYKEGFVHSGEYVNFRKRKFGISSAGISGDNFVVFIDNHDQAGNRATGDCLASLISFEKLKIASAAYLFSPYIPMLFMGEEYGDDSPFFYFISHSDEELVEMVRQGRKNEFAHVEWESEPTDPYDEQTFHRSKLQWKKIGDKKHQAIHRWYKELIRLRNTHPALKNFNKNDIWVNTMDDLLELHRRAADTQKEFICLINFSETASFSFTLPSSNVNWNKLVDANDVQWLTDGSDYKPLANSLPGKEKIMIPALTVVAYGN